MKRWYLYPFSILFHLVTFFRNKFYDWNIFSSKKVGIPTINVGNLSLGGNGKSPMVMYLVDLLNAHFRLGVLSRGYGRETKGYDFVNYDSTFKEVGDEAIQLFDRFKNKLVIGVCEDRVQGAKNLISTMNLEVLVLDDAYQHRRIKSGFNILMTDYHSPYFKDYLLPAGDLRESRNGAKRAQIIVVSKCPDDLTDVQKQEFISKINPKYYQKVFFSKIKYGDLVYSNQHQILVDDLSSYEVLLVTGIAKPDFFVKYVQQKASKVKHLKYRDHYHFKSSDIKEIKKEYDRLKGNKIILTTEKDYTRLKTFGWLMDKMYFLPIDMEIDETLLFNQTILKYVRKN